MYSDWVSLSPNIAANSNGGQSESVLNKFANFAGRDVAVAVVKQLSLNLGITQSSAEPSLLTKDEEVLWCMDVICHGLSLPLTEHETIKDCVNVYCEWLTALNTNQLTIKCSVPKPICDEPNVYARKMINHFHNLFVPRHGEVWPFLYQDELGMDLINRQAILCHRVLRTLQQIAQQSQILTNETWETLLLFLLAINEILLAPPIIKDDVGDQLGERVLSVLFEVWLLACQKSFPSPSMWKTLQESCQLLRHRIALIEQWNRVNLALTARLLEFTYGQNFPELKIGDEDAQLIPKAMSNDCIAQTWYRFLRTIGSPISLCSPQLISKTPQFMQWAIQRADGIEPFQHPCLLQLPQIFLKSIKGISSQVNAFLGIYQRSPSDEQIIDSLLLLNQNQILRHSAGDFKRLDTFGSSISNNNISGSSHNNNNNNNNQNNNSSNTTGGSNIIIGSGSGNSGITGNISNVAAAGGGGGGGGSGGIGGSNISINSGNLSNNYSASNNTSSIIDHTNNYIIPHSPTPPLQRRLAKSFSVAPSGSQHKGISKGSLIGLTSSRSTVHAPLTPNSSGPASASSLPSLPSLPQEHRPPLAATRPKCNSILHLFGEWLFEAAHIGGDTWLQITKKQATEASRRPSSMIMDNRKGSLSLSQPSSLTESADMMPAGLTIDKFESGRAEAIGALCRIFCAKKTGEEILPVYLARFYIAVQQGLKCHNDGRGGGAAGGSNSGGEYDEIIASILYNSADLFRLDLDGVQILLPAFIAALELVLSDKMKTQITMINKIDLRRASIHILLSILALPLHFQTLPIRDINNGDKMITFAQLKSKLMNILIYALQAETDAQNTHMLLGGLLMCVQDSTIYEDLNDTIGHSSHASQGGGGGHGNENAMPTTSTHHNDTNLLSSACSEKSASCSIASNSSLGGNSLTTATISNDFPSLTISDDVSADFFQDLECSPIDDSAHALFVRATYLVCHRLIIAWKLDLNVSLAALELLSGLARMQIKESDVLECKRAVKWICDYICHQCSRPPPAHSKDLHSTIVAAFQCTSAWLMQHPYLLQDKDCLQIVLEVVELGISGSKSVGKPGEPIKLKDDKELKPASMRVRDAAETLLTIILEQVGYFPSECGPQSTSSLLDEIALYKHCNSNPMNAGSMNSSVTQEQAIQKFRYVVTENSTILGLLEEPLGNDQDPQPTVTLLIRGPFGRHAWTMQLRHLPRSKSGSAKYHATNPGRPVPMNDMPMRQEVEQKCFPDGVDRVHACVVDYSIPTLETIVQKSGCAETIKDLYEMLEKQTIYEKMAWAETDCSTDSLSHAQEAVPPIVCHEFQAARLFLSHFGFLTMMDDGGVGLSGSSAAGGGGGGGGGAGGSGTNAKEKNENSFTQASPLLTVLDTKRAGFTADLYQLDKLSSRTHDTLHIFYVKIGQSQASQIIDNMSDENIPLINSHFWNVLMSLGWPVNIDEHSGWTGFHSNSWRIKTNTNPIVGGGSPLPDKTNNNTNTNNNNNNSIGDRNKFNGEKQILYWADVGTEIAFVVPTKWNKSDIEVDGGGGAAVNLSAPSQSTVNIDQTDNNKLHHPGWYERSVSVMPQTGPNKTPIGQKPRTLSLELDKLKNNNNNNQSSMNSSSGSSGSSTGSASGISGTGMTGSADPLPPTRRKTTSTRPSHFSQSGVKFFLVWLESFEDHLTFPIDDLLAYTKTGEESVTAAATTTTSAAGGGQNASSRASTTTTDCHIIFLHALNSGLLRVKLQGPTGRMNFATPLVDGMVISRRVVGSLVRQTVYNMAKRRRLDNESYQPPHVRRRLKVQDIVQKYKLNLSEPELLAHLFKNSF